MISGYYVLLVPGMLYNTLVSEDWAQFMRIIVRFFLMASAVLALRVLRNVLRESASNQLRQRLTRKLHSFYFSSSSTLHFQSSSSLLSLTSQSSSSSSSATTFQNEQQQQQQAETDNESTRQSLRQRQRHQNIEATKDMLYTAPHYYKIVHDKTVDNPDQRIVSDAREFSNSLFSVVVGDSGGILEAVASIIFYTYATYSRTGWFGVFAGWVWSGAAGALSLAAVNYASPVLFAQERFEATLRYAHARVRRHSEEIAFLRGGVWEKFSMDGHVGLAVQNQWAVIGRHAWLNALQKGFSYYVSIIMYVSLAIAIHGRFFSHDSSGSGLGNAYPMNGTPGEKAQWISQAGSVFMQLLFAFTMLVDLSTDVSNLVANVERLHTLVDELTAKMGDHPIDDHGHDAVEQRHMRRQDGTIASDGLSGEDIQPLIATAENDSDATRVAIFFNDEGPTNAHPKHRVASSHLSSRSFISLHDVCVRLDDVNGSKSGNATDFEYNDHARTVGPINLHVTPGKVVHLRGPTGSGKTSVLRVIRGLRSPASGLCERVGPGIVFVPQGPYVPVDATTLRQLVLYPRRPNMSGGERQQVLRALRLVGWHDPVVNIDLVGDWAVTLSPGQVQLIAAARVFCSRASIAVLDEATAALDEKAEATVILAFRSAGIGLLFVGHSRAMELLDDVQVVDVTS